MAQGDRSTSPLRWLIGAELKRHRLEARMTVAQASERSGIGPAKVAHLEVGRQQQDPEDIAALLSTYGSPDRIIDRLTSLTGRADEATWWAPWAQIVPDWFRTYVGLEGLAESVFVFEPFIIPGLLHTEEYAAANTSHAKSIRPDHGDRFVSFRMARADRLTDPERPLALHAVIPEGALRLRVGKPEVLRGQLQHLLDASASPTVTLQIVRPEDGPHSALVGGFVTLDFGQAARKVVFLEHKDGAVYLQEESETATYKMVAGDLQRVAMSPEQSRDLIASMLK